MGRATGMATEQIPNYPAVARTNNDMKYSNMYSNMV